MKRSTMLSAVAAATLLASAYQPVSAQGVGLYVGPPAAYDDDAYVGPPSYDVRTYGYRRYGGNPPPLRRGGCGEYRYWNGERCLDARVVPPFID